MKLATAALLLAGAASSSSNGASAFQPGRFGGPPRRAALVARTPPPSAVRSPTSPVAVLRLAAKEDDAEDEEEKPENPYADPSYPDLEFVDYSDPEYVVDQGIVGDEFFPSEAERAAVAEAEEEDEDVEAKIEEMRESRRKRNDEYQFETYHESVLKGGDEYRGEWTVYRTSTFLGDGSGKDGDEEEAAPPQLFKAKKDLRVVSSGRKVAVETDSEWRVDGERIVHEESVAAASESDDDEDGSAAEDKFAEEILSNKYWPDLMSAYDFRGPQGIMVVGNAYTICDAVPLNNGKDAAADGGNDDSDGDDDDDGTHDGPFSEYRAELGIQYKRMRMRVKLDYRAKDEDRKSESEHPPLHLKSMAVCRETRERWPRHSPGRTDVDDAASARLFGPPGADGGLYDPPPVGDDVQASRYMTMDLEGYATLLFPHRMDQSPEAFGGNGWVTSLDWTPGRIRYQVDRKVLGGRKIKGLRTLELSEVQGADASEYRPRDGGADMRQ